MRAKVLIVEDEILIADYLKHYLEEQGYHVIGTAISFDEAVGLFQSDRPDLVLLDIRLYGDKSGVDFGVYLQSHENPPPFIYLSSQTDHLSLDAAKRTFPEGYLPKPIRKESLATTMEIALFKSNLNGTSTDTISISDGSGHHVVPIQKITHLKAEHVYVAVHVEDQEQKILTRSTLKDLLSMLPHRLFVQTHRSFAVNLRAITGWDTQQLFIQETVVPVSRSRRKGVFDRIKSMNSRSSS